MTQFVLSQHSAEELQFPIQVRVMTEEETKEYHVKKLYELSIKSLGEIPQLGDPTDEQLQWVNRRMRASAKSWEAYNNNHV